MEAQMNHEEIFHVTDSLTSADGFCSSTADGSCSSPPPSAAFPADDDLHYGEVMIKHEEDSAMDDQILVHTSSDEPKEEETLKDSDETNHALIDTAAPFESVRAAVSRFRGIVDVKSEETQNLERHKNGQVELKKIQEDALKYQKQCEETEASKEQILKEVDDLKRLVEDLKQQVEKAETLEEQAKLDSQLALLRLKEVEDGIDSSESAATKAQLELAKERHATAVAELASVNQELASIQREHAAMLQERDLAIRRATEVTSSSKESERCVNDVSLQLIKNKELVESVHAAHLKAEERKVAAALTLDIEKMVLEKAAKCAEEELERLNREIVLTNDVQSKLDQASTLLVNLKAEVESYNHKKEASATSTVELEEEKSEMDKANYKVNCLRTELHSLQSELEGEKASLTTLRETEGSASVISSLEEELKRMDTELELTLLKRDDMHKEEIERILQPAIEEAEKAKVVADSAREELRKAKEDADKSEAAATAMEMSVSAAHGEIEAANKAIQLLISSRAKATKDRDDSSNGVTITLEEFHRLSKKANQEEEQNNTAMEPSPLSPQSFKEADESLEEKKEVLRDAMEKAGMAEEEAILMEQQLRRCRSELEREAKSNGNTSLPDFSALEFDNDFDGDDDDNFACQTATSSPRHLDMSNTDDSLHDNKRRKRMFLARVVMFLARKKAQSLK